MVIEKEIRSLADPQRALALKRFFKTGKGEYGEGDVFLGLTLPQIRGVVKKYRELSLPEIEQLLSSKYHECRLTALLILIEKFNRASPSEQTVMVKLYLANTKRINNWDLVDVTAHKILGVYLLHRDRSILHKLAKSKNLWEKRIAIMSTFWFIKQGDFQDSLVIAEQLLSDRYDLIHKAVGWMLREVGNRDRKMEKKFLDTHLAHMPRTMLRYAIEKFPEEERQWYLKRKT